MTTANLEPGRYSYDEILDGLQEGRWSFARVRSAAGRENFLIGFSPEQLERLHSEARRLEIGLALLGSRVSGPRARQRTLHPALAASLPLSVSSRYPSTSYPGADGIKIDKTVIKEHGLDSVHTSDVTIVLIDPLGRPENELGTIAAELELRLRELQTSFPIKVFPELDGRFFRSEEDFLAHGAAFLKTLSSRPGQFEESAWRAAFRELYLTVNLEPAEAPPPGPSLN